LTTAYHAGFASSLDELLVIGAAIALAGALGSFILVRQRDFVPSFGPAEGAGHDAEQRAPAGV
jgi:hypothetical protein